MDLRTAVNSQTLQPQSEGSSGKLSPQFVEWLIGVPLGWTELQPSEMPSSRKSQSTSDGGCVRGSTQMSSLKEYPEVSA